MDLFVIGGGSTLVIGPVLKDYGIFAAIKKKRAEENMAYFGICAGAIIGSGQKAYFRWSERGVFDGFDMEECGLSLNIVNRPCFAPLLYTPPPPERSLTTSSLKLVTISNSRHSNVQTISWNGPFFPYIVDPMEMGWMEEWNKYQFSWSVLEADRWIQAKNSTDSLGWTREIFENCVLAEDPSTRSVLCGVHPEYDTEHLIQLYSGITDPEQASRVQRIVYTLNEDKNRLGRLELIKNIFQGLGLPYFESIN